MLPVQSGVCLLLLYLLEKKLILLPLTLSFVEFYKSIFTYFITIYVTLGIYLFLVDMFMTLQSLLCASILFSSEFRFMLIPPYTIPFFPPYLI